MSTRQAGNISLNKMHILIVLAVLSAVTCPATASFISRPLENCVSPSHLIVTGEIVEVTGDKKERMKSRGKSYTSYYRLGYIKVDEVLKNDLAGITVKPGDKVEIKMPPTAKGVKKFRKQFPKDQLISGGSNFSHKEGDSGIWLLSFSKKYFTFNFFMHYARLEIARLNELRGILSRLELEYQAALKSEIPLYAEKQKELLSRPAFPQAKIDAAMGKPIPSEVDLSQVYVVNYGPLQALFIDNSGTVLGGIPYYASSLTFTEGRLPVATAVDGSYKKYNVIDRNGKLLSETFYSHVASFSQGHALVFRKERFGYIDVEGKEIIPCTYKRAESFSGGMARVVKRGRREEVLYIDKMGRTIHSEPSKVSFYDGLRRVSFHDGLRKVSSYDEDKKVEMWGFADKQGKIVIPHKFRVVRDFSDGMAAVETSVWKKRYAVEANDPAIRISEKAPQHFLFPRWGFINKKGEMVIPPLFDSVGGFVNGLAHVKIYVPGDMSDYTKRFEGLTDKAGKVVFIKSSPNLRER